MDPDIKPKTLRRPGVARRQAVLDAAADVFLREGYERASVAQINALAGGSKAFIYEQFGDKAGLFRAVMTSQCDSILSPVHAGMAAARPPTEVLFELGRGFLQALWRPENVALLRTIYAEGPRHPEIAESFFEKYDVAADQLAEYLASCGGREMDGERRCRLAMTFFMIVRGDALDRRLADAPRQRTAEEKDAQVVMAVEWLLGAAGLA